jgi:hydrogenase nickel incorporation protein HypA/HybF
MHEYSIVQALLNKVEAECASRGAFAVHRLSIRIGELSGVEPDLLATAWETFREDSICRGAPMEIRRVPARWACPTCAEPIAKGARLQCPVCRIPAKLAEGDEIVLDQIEMEVA